MIIFKAAEKLLEKQAKLDNSLKSENWKNVQPYSDGCRLHYGVHDGKFFAYGEQDDINEIKQYCRERRMEEANNPNAYKWLGVVKWVMPKILELELMARGYPIEQMIATGELKELDKVFEKEYPEFKTTNLTLTTIK